MPLYRYACPTCSAKQDVFSKIDERDLPVPCMRCKQNMVRTIAAPMVAPDYAGYECPRTGKWIEGRKAHEENLKRLGCRVLEPGEKEAFDKRKAAEDVAFSVSIDNTVEELIYEMPVRKREELYSEMQAGATTEIIRGDGLPNK